MAKGDFTIEKLSASTNGRPIAITTTASAGDTLHTASGTSGEIELVTVEVTNIDTVQRTIYVQWGGTSTSDQIGPIHLPPYRGPVIVADRRALQGGLSVKAYADAANVLNVTGQTVRYTTT